MPKVRLADALEEWEEDEIDRCEADEWDLSYIDWLMEVKNEQ